MTAVELFQHAIRGLNASVPGISLMIPAGKYPKGFPRGELLVEQHDGTRIYSFHPEKILKYLVTHEAVRVVKREGNLVEFEIVGEAKEKEETL